MTQEKGIRPQLIRSREIEQILPHRYPFLMIDYVAHIDLENNEIIAMKNVTVNEPFFQGHFPNAPIMPGVMILEALAQTGGILVYKKGYTKEIAVLLNVANAKFRKSVFPGDVLSLHATGVHISGRGGKIRAKAMVQDQLAVEAELSFALTAKERL